MQETSQPEDASLVSSVAASIPGYIFRFRRSAHGDEQLDYVSPGFDQIWELAPNEDRTDPVTHWSRVFEDDIEGFEASIEQAIQTGNWDFRYRIWLPGGGQKWLHGQGKVVFSEDGGFVIDGMIIDVTDQIKLEQDLKETQERLAQAQKMEAIGNLTGGIAHDFNNLLAVILANLELMQDSGPGEDISGYVDGALKAVHQASGLTSNMLAFARRAPLMPRVIDLNETVRELESWSSRVLPDNVVVETSLLAGLRKIEADPNATQTAILNLVLNARDAMPNGGRLTIKTANVRIDQDYRRSHKEDIPTGRYVMLAVSDTGSGISEAVLSRVFEPFFTTKLTGSGSGLGLSMVEGFMHQTGGTIRVYSELGVGTSFKLYFPALTAPERQDQEHRTDQAKPHSGHEGGNRLLVVEDQPDVLAVIAAMLVKSGYVVMTAGNGDDAYDRFQADPSIELLITDIVMPGRLQGTDLAKELRRLRPDLPVVFMSGNPGEVTVHSNELRPKDIRLMKPVGRSQLLEAVNTALRGRN